MSVNLFLSIPVLRQNISNMFWLELQPSFLMKMQVAFFLNFFSSLSSKFLCVYTALITFSIISPESIAILWNGVYRNTFLFFSDYCAYFFRQSYSVRDANSLFGNPKVIFVIIRNSPKVAPLFQVTYLHPLFSVYLFWKFHFIYCVKWITFVYCSNDWNSWLLAWLNDAISTGKRLFISREREIVPCLKNAYLCNSK